MVQLRLPCWLIALLSVSGVVTLMVGCGPSAPFEIVPVSGKVQYEDGTPIPGNRVIVEFYSQTPPKSPKEHPRKGTAQCDADGNFAHATTWKFADGAIVGPHKVVVQSLDAHERFTEAVPTEYSNPSTTPLKIEVVAGGAPLEIRLPKPTK